MARPPRKAAADRHILDQLAAGVPTPLGDLLRQAHQELVTTLEAGLSAAGWTDVGAAHVSVLATVHPDGSRLTSLTRRGVRTKQSVASLLSHLVSGGYLDVRADGNDARAKLFVPTKRALRLLADSERVVSEYRTWLAGALGITGVQELRRSLQVIIDGQPGPGRQSHES